LDAHPASIAAELSGDDIDGCRKVDRHDFGSLSREPLGLVPSAGSCVEHETATESLRLEVEALRDAPAQIGL
jgi:hypothetical protein